MSPAPYSPSLLTAGTIPPPPTNADFATVWAFLKEGFDYIMNKSDTGVSYAYYMTLYTVSYNYCTSSKHKICRNGRSAADACWDLYKGLIQYFTEHVEGLRDYLDKLSGESLIQCYAQEWDRYISGAKNLDRLLTHFNRHWVKPRKDEGRKGLYTIYNLSLVRWQTNFIYEQNMQQKLTEAILKLVEHQQKGETIQQGLLNKAVDSFLCPDLTKADTDETPFDFYHEYLETAYIAPIEKACKQWSDAFLAENSVFEYLKGVEERLQKEEDSVDPFPNTETRKKLISRCEHVLIRDHSDVLVEKFQALLDCRDDANQDEDLHYMYTILARTPNGLGPFGKKFEDHVKKAGLVAALTLVGEGEAAVDTLDLKVYVETLVEVCNTNREKVNRWFEGDAGFIASLDRGCEAFVNCNTITGTSTTKAPELLATHADALLRKSHTAEDDLAGALNQFMVLFKYIGDKDVFQIFYTTKLCKRLISGASTSDESEANMISKLKEACGFEYTVKLQRMFNDISVSKDLTHQFKQHSHDGAELDVSFNVMILGTNSWPLHAPISGYTIPREIQPTLEHFQRYYREKHSGRKLTWLWNYSRNELLTNYLNQKYIIMTNSYQTAVLLQYNDHDTLSFEEIVARTATSEDILRQVLDLLTKAKLLISEETDQYRLNPGFKYKKIRVNLNQPLKAELKAESTDVLKTVDTDRRYAIQATVVRIMKSHKTIEIQPLVQEVISQISKRFMPKINDIRNAIDMLLEKEYIERVEGARDTLAYVA